MKEMWQGERRLVAIMFTDLVGYSSATSLDEELALKLLEEQGNLLQPLISKHGGTLVKSMGDGFLVEFASAVEAVKCAIQAQKSVRMLNERRRQDARILLRIGIHVGDVVHIGADILGDVVNVAARVQRLAGTGGICVTKQVVDLVEGMIRHKMIRLGNRGLRNIWDPVEIYEVQLPKGPRESEELTLGPVKTMIDANRIRTSRPTPSSGFNEMPYSDG